MRYIIDGKESTRSDAEKFLGNGIWAVPQKTAREPVIESFERDAEIYGKATAEKAIGTKCVFVPE